MSRFLSNLAGCHDALLDKKCQISPLKSKLTSGQPIFLGKIWRFHPKKQTLPPSDSDTHHKVSSFCIFYLVTSICPLNALPPSKG